MSLSSPFLTDRENHMKPETEVKTSLNVLYHAVFSEGTDQLVVSKLLKIYNFIKSKSGSQVDFWKTR